MFTKLSSSSNLTPLGTPSGRRLFKLAAGSYAGRLVAVYSPSVGELCFSFADSPYHDWSSPSLIASDCADQSFDAVLLADNSIIVAYPNADGVSLSTRRLAFSGGSWSPAATVTAYTGATCLHPTLAAEPGGKLWLAWTRLVTPNRFVHVKASVDNGASWGSGSSDPGETLATDSTFLIPRLLAAPETLHAVIAFSGAKLAMRSKTHAGGPWSSEYVIASGTNGFGDQYDAALGANGQLGVVYSDTQLRFREYDGLAWSAAVTLSSYAQVSPQVIYRDTIPHVFWLEGFDGSQKRLVCSSRLADTFSPAEVVDPRADLFGAVLLFNSTSGVYANLTTAASNLASADLVHPTSNRFVLNSGDAILIGIESRFRHIHYALSTVGAGGTVAYSYWDGSAWNPVTPTSGLAHLDTAQIRVHLWDDYHSIPTDWQKKTIAGLSRFWIKCEVVSAFSTGPVGSHVTAIAELGAVSLLR